ncbi:MAG: hypothetical protein NTW91_09505 [Verrucomicrobia bacterium]|nr:hypothetical protein [Verrucomicrobiota bacterium]
MIAFKNKLGMEECTVSVCNGWLEFWMGQSLIYDIALKDFRDPSEAAFWWRQLTGKTWFTPGLCKRVAEAVAGFLHIS